VADRFRYRSEPEFFGWLVQVARQHIADRHEYWSALRRDPGRLLRITSASWDGAGERCGVQPAASSSGPPTLASRKEQIALALKALAFLLRRDQDLVRWTTEDRPIAEMADRLGLSYEAAERARLRAVDRFRKAYALVLRRARP